MFSDGCETQYAQLGRLIKREEWLYMEKAILKTFINVNNYVGVEAVAANGKFFV